MNPDIASLASQTLMLAFRLSLPVVAACTVTGLILSVLQAVTQIQEQTLPFLAKLIAAFAATMLTGYWMSGQLSAFTLQVFQTIGQTGLGGAR